MKMKIWLWIFEFKLKRVADDKKIEFLVRNLLEELESQGYSLQSFTTGHIDIWNHEGSDLTIENISKKWSIKCGKYKHNGGLDL